MTHYLGYQTLLGDACYTVTLQRGCRELFSKYSDRLSQEVPHFKALPSRQRQPTHLPELVVGTGAVVVRLCKQASQL